MALTTKVSTVLSTKQIAAGASVSTAGQYIGASGAISNGLWVYTNLASKITAYSGQALSADPASNFPQIKIEVFPQTSAATATKFAKNALAQTCNINSKAGVKFSNRFDLELPKYFGIRITNDTDKVIPSGLTATIEYKYTS